MGIKEILEQSKDDSEEDYEKLTKKLRTKKIHLPLLTVAAVTFSGGEEIGIYTALFATNNEVVAIITLICVGSVLPVSTYCHILSLHHFRPHHSPPAV
jgi:cadmium resistance protein CadD (predicted permease)